MLKINEIFYSLQGEGHHTGRASVFVRFSGCNLKCPFCDTEHQSGREMSVDEIIAEVNRYPGDWVVLTGGEPSLYIDADFVQALKQQTGKMVAIETNGTRPLPTNLDWVTVSPKNVPGGRVDCRVVADEIKVVDEGQPLEPYFEMSCRGPLTRMYLQPCHVADPDQFRANTERTVARVLDDPRWHLSIQSHKYLNIQ